MLPSFVLRSAVGSPGSEESHRREGDTALVATQTHDAASLFFQRWQQQEQQWDLENARVIGLTKAIDRQPEEWEREWRDILERCPISPSAGVSKDLCTLVESWISELRESCSNFVQQETICRFTNKIQSSSNRLSCARPPHWCGQCGSGGIAARNIAQALFPAALGCEGGAK